MTASCRFRAVILASAVLAGCDSLATNPSLYGSVDVRVTRRSGDGIPGASLILYTFQRPMAYATSDGSGAYRFATVPEGLYAVAAVPPEGYVNVADTLTPLWDHVDELAVPHGGVVNARLHFLKQGFATIVAEVNEFGGPALGQVAVTVRGRGGLHRTGTTDAAGRFSFDSLPAGSYAVTALRTVPYLDAASPLLVRDSVIVEDGNRETVSFAFIRTPASAAVAQRAFTGRVRRTP